MRKLVILMLVLGMASFASAGLVLTIEDTSGTVDPDTLVKGESYTVWVSGLEADQSITGGVYGPAGTAADWTKVSLSNPVVEDAAGDTSGNSYVGAYFGYDFAAGDTSTAILPDGADGKWFSWDLDADAVGDFSLLLYDYTNINQTTALSTTTGKVLIPEPMTIALLGLGGLLLRRRK